MRVINSAAVLACDQIFMVPFTTFPMIDDGVCIPIGFDVRRLFGKSTQSLCGVVGIRGMGYGFHSITVSPARQHTAQFLLDVLNGRQRVIDYE